MAFEGQSECAVHECGSPCSAWANLCERHKVGGVVVEIGAGSGVVTLWYAEHNNQFGLILLCDWELGHHFGRAAGFKDRLKKQGFTNVRNLITPEEFDSACAGAGKTAGNWSGPWSTKYPWEPNAK
jgi:tRNA G46 methylase TrmB